MLDKKTAHANITLALKLGLFSAVMFIMTMIVGELVVHA